MGYLFKHTCSTYIGPKFKNNIEFLCDLAAVTHWKLHLTPWDHCFFQNWTTSPTSAYYWTRILLRIFSVRCSIFRYFYSKDNITVWGNKSKWQVRTCLEIHHFFTSPFPARSGNIRCRKSESITSPFYSNWVKREAGQKVAYGHSITNVKSQYVTIA